MDIQGVKALERLMLRKREIEAELKVLNGKIQEAEQGVLDEMASEGVQAVNTGESTLYLMKQVFVSVCSGVERGEVAQRLKAAGLGGYVTEGFNLNSLSAYYRESEEQPVEGLELNEKYKIGLRRSSNGKK